MNTMLTKFGKQRRALSFWSTSSAGMLLAWLLLQAACQISQCRSLSSYDGGGSKIRPASSTYPLLPILDFCEPASYTHACQIRHHGRRDLYCLPQMQKTRDVMMGYCQRHKTAVAEGLSKGHKFIVAQYDLQLGWGNRLPGMIAGLLLAVLTNRTLLIDFDLFHEVFTPGAGSLSFRVPDEIRAAAKRSVEPYGSIDSNIKVLTQDYEAAYGASPVWALHGPNDYFGAALQANPHYRAFVADHFPNLEVYWYLSHLLLVPGPSLWSQAVAFMEQHQLHTSYTVGLQIRVHKSFLDNPEASIQRFMELARSLALVHSHLRPVRYFVTGDDARVFAMAGEVLGPEAVWTQAANETKLRTKAVVPQEGNPGTETTALLDMLLLAHCSDMIGSVSSSFAGCASGWGGLHPYYISNAPDAASGSPFYWHHSSSEPCFYASNWLAGSPRSPRGVRDTWAQHPARLQHQQCHWSVVDQKRRTRARARARA